MEFRQAEKTDERKYMSITGGPMSARGFRFDDMPTISFGTAAPVFIVGMPRSGTSLLVRLMRKYLNINFGSESQFIVSYFKRLHKFGNLSDPRNMDRLIRKVIRERCFARWRRQYGFSIDPDLLKQNIKEPNFRSLLDAIYGQFARYAGRQRWGDKYPPHCLDMPVLETLYPEAQYVHIIRDGRDVALSLQKVNFGPKNFLQIAFCWQHYITSAQKFGDTVPQTRYHEIRYENLLRDPVGVMSDLARFVQIEKGFQEVVSRIRKQIHGDLETNNILKWKTGLTQTQIQMFEKGGGDLLQSLGYGVHAWDGRGPSCMEKTVSYFHNIYCCCRNSQYLRNQFSHFRTVLRRL